MGRGGIGLCPCRHKHGALVKTPSNHIPRDPPPAALKADVELYPFTIYLYKSFTHLEYSSLRG